MMIKCLIFVALFVCIAESAPAHNTQQQRLLQELMNTISGQQDGYGDQMARTNQNDDDDDEDEGLSTAEIEMMRGFMEAQQDHEGDIDPAVVQGFWKKVGRFTRKHRSTIGCLLRG
jgi:hypothetical protein